MGFRDEEEMRDYDRMDERGYGRGRYNMRDDDMRYADYDRMDEMSPYMGERRGRSPYTGRYVRR